MNIKKFLKVNGLKQKELADYLQISEPAVSKMVNGKANPSEENYEKLIKNDRGWDISMLTEIAEVEATQVIGGSGITAGRDVHQTVGPEERLVAALEEAIRQNSRLISVIENLTKAK